jgi:GT2 family glycosyltransferase
MEEKSLARALRRLRPEQARTTGPLVSLVVANRDGADHLRRLLDGLDQRTRYRAFEVVLVDNNSSDDSVELVENWPGPSRVIRNPENRSFSATNNQGVLAAQGELVLLANNDIDPIHPDWLGFMVESLLEGAAAVGAMLVYPKRRAQKVPPVHPDFTIQHLGVAFENAKWGVRASNVAGGTDPLSIEQPGRRAVPVVTAACLLARRTDLLEHPLDEEYWYGAEDWDLCLRLRQRGDVVIDERAVLFHHEYGTQDRFMTEAWLETRTRNHVWFNELWGPSIRRRLRDELTAPGLEYHFRQAGRPTAIVVPGPNGKRVADAVKRQAVAAGWGATDDEKYGADAAIAFGPPEHEHRFAGHDLSVAVVLGQEDAWARSGALDAAKSILVPDRLGQARVAAAWGSGIAEIHPGVRDGSADLFGDLLGHMAPRPDSMRIGISTCAPTWEKAQYWGDTHLARGLMRAFRRLGHETVELIKPDWRAARATSCDVVIHLRGLGRRPVARGQWNLMWIISHPDRIEPDEYDDYDVIACASHSHAQHLTERLGRQVHVMPQATDVDTFKIGPPEVDYESSVLYVGSARWPNRRAPRWLMNNGRQFDLYGRNWDDFPEAKLVRDDYIDNRDLPAAYRSASVVVADHHGSMRTGGFVANRLFDVLASGGLVLSDDVTGLATLFGDTVPTYTDAPELESQIRVLLSDAALRRRLAAKGREIVLSEHTLDHRAAEWLRLLDQI